MNIYALLSYLAQPVVLLFGALGLCLVRIWWAHPELRRKLRGVMCFYVLLMFISLPITQFVVVGSLERQYPAGEDRNQTADAIVVLSGDVLQPNVMRSAPEPGPTTIYRCLHAADLYRSRPCPIIVTGATSDPDKNEIGCAPVMRDLLIKLGVKPVDLIVEDGSYSTYENARACKKILEEKSFGAVILVTDATHLPRAVRCFEAQGIQVIPSGCMYRSSKFSGDPWELFPNLDAAKWVQRAVHEWQGFAWYWLRGRI